LQKWLYESKKVNERYNRIAEYYARYGERYGIRWDFALFQACLETGFFTFGGDVDPAQNNFAGIGATGGGVKGEAFPSQEAGVLAHIQHLATYAGVDMPDGEIVAKRTKEVKKIILGKAKTFAELTGKWAMDTKYWEKITNIAREFDVWFASQPTRDVTWFEMNRNPAGDSVVIAYAADQPMAILTSNDKEIINEFFGRYKKAQQVRVAPAGKEIPHLPEYGRGEIIVPPRTSMGQSGQRRRWISWAKDIGKIATQGTYRRGFPEGAIVHHTAGASLAGDHSALAAGPYPCLIIDRDGTVYQPMPLDRWGYHSGTYHHQTHVGIEICGAGLLKKVVGGYRSWFGRLYQDADVRIIPASSARNPIPIPGPYHKFTKLQEDSLIQLLLYLKNEAPDIFSFDRVIGHDEACAEVGKYGRKNDPGGSLSMTMPELRKFLAEEWNLITT